MSCDIQNYKETMDFWLYLVSMSLSCFHDVFDVGVLAKCRDRPLHLDPHDHSGPG